MEVLSIGVKFRDVLDSHLAEDYFGDGELGWACLYHFVGRCWVYGGNNDWEMEH